MALQAKITTRIDFDIFSGIRINVILLYFVQAMIGPLQFFFSIFGRLSGMLSILSGGFPFYELLSIT